MSLLGVCLAVALLILLIYKRINLIAATLVALIVLSVTSGIGFLDLTMKHYAVSLGDFVAKYFLMFVANALFGKIMEEGLLASAFARMIGRLFGARRAAFGAMLATVLLTYGGISVFVIVFTVYPIFLVTFREANLPRRFIPAAIMGSSCTLALSMLPGSAQLNNIIPTLYIHTSPLAAPLISLICSAFSLAFLFAYFAWLFSKARSRGELFTADEAVLRRIAAFDREAGFPAWLSALPLVTIIALINFFRMDLSLAVLAGCVLALAIGHKNLPNKLHTITAGVNSLAMPMVTMGASVGFGGAVLACPGAQSILHGISSLPVSPAISLTLAAGFSGAITGNGGGGADVAMRILGEPYLARGVPPELLHRIVAIATAALSCLPHNGMQITVIDTCGFSSREAYGTIFVSTVLNGILCLVVANLLGAWLY